jgi:hypothetical protein
MQNFSSLASTQTGLDIFLTIFEKKNQDFSGKLFSKFKKNPNLTISFYIKPSKHVHAKFQLSSFYPDGLRQFLEHIFEKCALLI